MNKHATPFGEIHLVAVDLDGTLLQPDMRLSDRARNAILRIQKTGVEVVIASGRPYCSLPETVTQLPGLSYYLQWCGNSPFARWGADLGLFPIPGRS